MTCGYSATVQLFRIKGFELVINDDIVESIVFIGNTAIALATWFLASLYASACGFSATDHLLFQLMSIALGFVISTVLLKLLLAGVATVYLCFADKPQDFEVRVQQFSSSTQ